MLEFGSLARDIEKLALLGQRVERAIGAAAETAGVIGRTVGFRIADQARDMLGTYQPASSGPMGSYREWEPLKESTLERRARSGINSADQPLLESGAQRDAIRTSDPITIGSDEVVFVIGYTSGDRRSQRSADVPTYAARHEEGDGTNNEPARAVLGPAANIVTEEVEGMIGEIMVRFMGIMWS